MTISVQSFVALIEQTQAQMQVIVQLAQARGFQADEAVRISAELSELKSLMLELNQENGRLRSFLKCALGEMIDEKWTKARETLEEAME